MNQIVLFCSLLLGFKLSLGSHTTYRKLSNLDTTVSTCAVKITYNKFVKVSARSSLECASVCKIKECVRFYYEKQSKDCRLNMKNALWNPGGAGNCRGSFWRKPTTCPMKYSYIEQLDGCYFVGLQPLLWNQTLDFCSETDKRGHAIIAMSIEHIGSFKYFQNQTTQCPSYLTYGITLWMGEKRLINNNKWIIRWFLPQNETMDVQRGSGTATERCLGGTANTTYFYDCNDKFCVLCEYDME